MILFVVASSAASASSHVGTPAFPIAAQIVIAVVIVAFGWIIWKTIKNERERNRGPRTHSNAYRSENWNEKERLKNGGGQFLDGGVS